MTVATQWYLYMYHLVASVVAMVDGALSHQRTRQTLAFLANPMVVELVTGQQRNYLRLMMEKKVHA